MIINEDKIKGVYVIELVPHFDERGFFMRTYDEKIFKEVVKISSVNGNSMFEWVQENHSKSIHKGVIRGLHFQLPPFTETKLIRCIKGEVQDVCVDLRKESDTFGQWSSVILTEDNYKCIMIPRGCAHGFCTLTDNCEVLYKVDNYYSPEYERGLIWNDPDIGIKWQVENSILSEKDKNNKTFKELMREWGDEGMRI